MIDPEAWSSEFARFVAAVTGPGEGSPATAQPERKAWEPYGELINREVERQDEIKASLEGRGNLIITSSGALVTLLFGITAVVTGVTGFDPSERLLYFLATSLVLLGASAFCGLAANWPMKYKYPLPSELRRLTTSEDYWTGRTSIGQRVVSDLEIEMAAQAVSRNQIKSGWVIGGLILEVLGIAVLAAGLFLEVLP